MMTFSQPPTYGYDHYSSTLGKGTNKLSTERGYYGSPSSTSSRGSLSMAGSTSNPRTLPPYISVHRASEPASPATIATTISSHSTPSPSPSRQTHMRGNTSNADFTLFDDDVIMAVTQNFNNSTSKGRTTLDVSATMAENSSGLNSYPSSAFPIILPHDASYPTYAQPGIYSSGYSAPDATTNLYSLGQDHQPQQHQQNANKYLHPASYSYPNNGSGHRSTSANSEDVEPIENVPALSPTSRQRSNLSPTGANVQQRSPRSPIGDQSGVSNYNAASSTCEGNHIYTNALLEYLQNLLDMQSVVPKPGRTLSNATQDDIYNSGRKLSQSSQASSRRGHEIKAEPRRSFPHIFREAQQQHQQDFSTTSSPQHDMGRDRSPFRHNSPFHPTNTAPYGIGYDNSNTGLQQGQLPHNIDQFAITLALHEQLRKEAEQKVTPKTISPRDSLLEYRESESQQSQVNLFPPLPNSRMTIGQEDAVNNGSLPQDGSEMEDFHSMATSRRESMANSSASSHLDVPRFGYLQQASYDSSSYCYPDSSSLGMPLQVGDASVPYIKEETDYTPIIQRPLDTSANTGSYTCTYSGCGRRFTTTTKLQKHRRESHKKSAPSGNSVSTAAAIASRNAQPGPHRCMRVNPSTGKPCNTVFSRPYDLTRHEDTIHNSAKLKVRCEICNDEKTFSRSDALVRHRRVKHGIH